MTETTDSFIPYLRLVIYVNILFEIASVSVAKWFRRWPINPKDVGSRPNNCFFFIFILFLFLLLLLVFHNYYYYSAISTLI